jgi:methyl-accepting chemotaxis protein
MAEERKKVWVDAFQTELTRRIIGYFIVFCIVFFNLLFSWKLWIEGPNDPGEKLIELLWSYLPVFSVLILLMPVIIWDTIRFTHRLVGPLVRFRKTMQSIADGELVHLIKLREGDSLGEFRDDFNHMLRELQKRGVIVLKPLGEEPESNTQKKIA